MAGDETSQCGYSGPGDLGASPFGDRWKNRQDGRLYLQCWRDQPWSVVAQDR